MSVIVTNMDMPTCCAGCDFGKRWDNESCLCERKPWESPVPDGYGRPSFCPLKEAEDKYRIHN